MLKPVASKQNINKYNQKRLMTRRKHKISLTLEVYRFQFLASAESIAPINPKKAAPEQIEGMFRTNNTAKRLPTMPERKYITAILTTESKQKQRKADYETD